ncbi:MAG: beta-ketoacyl-ACP synthase III [Fusicatenibacter sp.]
MSGKIVGTGSCVPEKIVSNDDLAKIVDTSDAWIRERTGVARRHVSENETVVSMACVAAQRALKDAQMKAEELDLILVGTSSSSTIFPSAACEMQHRIGAVHAACMDVSAACTGFLAVYQMGQAYIRSGMAQKILLIGADTLSRLVNWTDRGTCILFGDGAGAVVLTAGGAETACEVMHSDGQKGSALTCDSRYRDGARDLSQDPSTYIRMDGKAVFQFALSRVPEVIRETLERAGCTTEDIDYYVLHQANIRIIDGVTRRLHEKAEKFPSNIEEYGNTCAASVPILLDELNRAGKLKKGQKLILSGFGAGLSWGAALLEWQK